MQTRSDGGPAFPAQDSVSWYTGMTLRQHACINLCVPDSGDEWLDEIIRKALRDRFAEKALPQLIAEVADIDCDDLQARATGLAHDAYVYADAMLARRAK